MEPQSDQTDGNARYDAMQNIVELAAAPASLYLAQSNAMPPASNSSLGNQKFTINPQQSQGQLPLQVLQQLLAQELSQSQQSLNILHQSTFMHPSQLVPQLVSSTEGLYQNLMPRQFAQGAPAAENYANKRPRQGEQLNNEDYTFSMQANRSSGQDQDEEYEEEGDGEGFTSANTLQNSRAKNREAQRRFRERQKSVIGHLRSEIDTLETDIIRSEARAQALEAQNTSVRSKLETLQFSLMAGVGNLGGAGGGGLHQGHGHLASQGQGIPTSLLHLQGLQGLQSQQQQQMISITPQQLAMLTGGQSMQFLISQAPPPTNMGVGPADVQPQLQLQLQPQPQQQQLQFQLQPQPQQQQQPQPQPPDLNNAPPAALPAAAATEEKPAAKNE